MVLLFYVQITMKTMSAKEIRIVVNNHLGQDGVKSANVLGSLNVKDTDSTPHGKTAIADFFEFQIFH